MVPSRQPETMPSGQLANPVITCAALCLVLLKASEKKLAPAQQVARFITHMHCNEQYDR